VDNIRAHNRALQAMLRDALEARTPGWRWPEGDVGGTLCIDTGADQPRVAEALAAHGISTDFRGSIARLSFHAYNGARDVEAVARAFLP
jgi:selenocysteine lyase/cysteine desulfurase